MNALKIARWGVLAWAAAAILAFAGEQSGEAGKTEKVVKKCAYSTQECLNSMASRMKASGWIGIEYDPEKNYAITRVIPGSPAEKAGLLVGDQLFALGGIEIRDENDEALKKARKAWAPGQVVTYTVKRDGVARKVEITLGVWPADLLARWIGEHMLEHAEYDAAVQPTTK